MTTKRYSFMEQAGDPAGAASGTAAGAATSNGATGAPAGQAAPASGDQGAAAGGASTPGASLIGQGDNTWLPEKFRVASADGKLDVDASARKLAASYGELEKRHPNTGTLPKTADEYQPDGLPKDFDFDALKGDAVYQGFLKGAHAKGMTNEQVGFVLAEYNKLAPELLAANTRIGAAEAKTELGKVWGTDDKAMTQNLQAAARAVRGFGGEGDKPGAVDRLMAKYGNDPDFLAFAAKIGKEMAEDTPITAGTPAAQDWDAQVAKLKASPAYADDRHPEHKTVMAQMNDLYSKRYGTKPQQLTGAAIR